jgi:hypothetical protein
MNWLRRSGFVSNSTTIMTWLIRVPFSMILGIVAPYATLRQVIGALRVLGNRCPDGRRAVQAVSRKGADGVRAAWHVQAVI